MLILINYIEKLCQQWGEGPRTADRRRSILNE